MSADAPRPQCTEGTSGSYTPPARRDVAEPSFLLSADDPLSPQVVRMWAAAAQSAGYPAEQVRAAYDCSVRMDEWRKRGGR